MTKEAVFLRTSLRVYQTIRSHILEDSCLHRCSTLQSHNHLVLLGKHHDMTRIIVLCDCNIHHFDSNGSQTSCCINGSRSVWVSCVCSVISCGYVNLIVQYLLS